MFKKIFKFKKEKSLVDQIRDAGGKVGENVQIFSAKIDIRWAFLLSIGNNVVISQARIFASRW